MPRSIADRGHPSASVSNSISIVTPAAMACVSSATGLAGPRETARFWAKSACRVRLRSSTRGCDVEAVHQRAQVLDHRRHRVGLDGVAKLNSRRQIVPKVFDASRDQTPIIGKERCGTDPLRKPIDPNTAHDQSAGHLSECLYRRAEARRSGGMGLAAKSTMSSRPTEPEPQRTVGAHEIVNRVLEVEVVL